MHIFWLTSIVGILVLRDHSPFARIVTFDHNRAQLEDDCFAQFWLNERRLKIDYYLNELLESNLASPLAQAIRYSVLSPGKRIRSLMTLAVVEYLGGQENQAIHAACAIEMIHAASLILDDLPCMDNDALRRNRCSTHVRFGEDTSILAAVSLLTQSYCTVASDAKLTMPTRLDIIKLFCQTIGAQGLSLGQSMDLSAKLIASSPDTLTNMHYLKTGALFNAAANTGCLIAQALPEQHACIMRYTNNLGLAFQLMDDLQDEKSEVANLATAIGKSQAHQNIKDYIQTAKSALHPQAQSSKNSELLNHFADAFFASVLS